MKAVKPGRENGSGSERNSPPRRATAGFSIAEMIMTVGLISVLLAFAVPNFVNLMPARKAEVGEIRAYLDTARARAIARQQDVYVCFASGLFHVQGYQYRACGMFEAANSAEEAKPVDTRELVMVEKWKLLSPELIFSQSEDLKHRGGVETIIDSKTTREFKFRFVDGGSYRFYLPYLLFNRTGRLELPSNDGNEVFVGVIQGQYDPIERKRNITENDELLTINNQNGRIGLVRDY